MTDACETLHAYVDGELDEMTAARMARIMAYDGRHGR